MAQATQEIDARTDGGAQSRAWFHFREGELAFSAGAIAEAERDESDAITIFPRLEQAWRALARFCWASKDWGCTLQAARKAMALAPLPESAGYAVDALRAQGRFSDAAQFDALIHTIERVGNAYHISDRAIALYYTEHHEDASDVAIACVKPAFME